MSNYKIKYSKVFKKSLKKVIKQGKNIDNLLEIVELLSNKEKLELKYRDHALTNDKRFKNCRDCHIEPDWILIYEYLDEYLVLINTGSHSDIF